MRLCVPAAFFLVVAACSGGGGGSATPTSTPTPVPTPGITAHWVVNKAGGCGAVPGAASISILATLQGTASAYQGTAPCLGTTSAGIIAVVVPSSGTYSVIGSLLNSGAASIADSAVQSVAVSGAASINVSITPP